MEWKTIVKHCEQNFFLSSKKQMRRVCIVNPVMTKKQLFLHHPAAFPQPRLPPCAGL